MSDWVARCDEHSDCWQGEEICCATSKGDGSLLACLPPEECNLADTGTGVSTLELCESPVMSKRACSQGVACSTTSATLPGFTFCRLPTSP
jgi:hypothetical protein